MRMANFSNVSTPPVQEAVGIVAVPPDAHNRRHDGTGSGAHVRSTEPDDAGTGVPRAGRGKRHCSPIQAAS